jgi:hypothetical protein
MTTALRMSLILPFLALMFASPAAARRHRQSVAAEKPDEAAECLRLASRGGILGAPGAELLNEDRELGSVHFSGAVSLSDDALWELVGGPPAPPLSRKVAIALVSRLAQTGLFSAIEPRLRTLPGAERPELDLALTENPQVRSVKVHGLSEFRTEDIVAQLLEAPTDRERERRKQQVRDARARECPAPLPPRAWLARFDDGEVRGGLLLQGLRPALDRVLRFLKTRGYALARLEGELTSAGELLINVDEGRVGNIEVRGADAHLVREIAAELGIERGDVFSGGEMYSALKRVERRWPFLHADRGSRRSSPDAVLRVEERADGEVEFRSELPFDSRKPRDDDDDDDDDRDGAWYGFDGDTLVVYLRSESSHTTVQWAELFRHTPVTGFAPGLAGTLTIYDRGDRAHLLLDGAINFNTRRPNLDAAAGTFFERLDAAQRTDWLLGSRLRIPVLAIAELGAQLHTLTDTSDRWRISAFDSYLYSALLNRADREYYRRSGFAAFITAHLFEELTLGAEYRLDQYEHLAAPNGVWSLFNREDPRYGSAPVDEGEMGSAVFRLEYHSEKVPLHQVGSIWRNSETSLIPAAAPWTIGLRSLNTFEVADPSLGGTFDFTKLVSDTSVTLETGRYNTVTLRLRGAGGHDLPLQKQEALGGWNALRGYDFKEFRGDRSLLGTLQLDGHFFGAFFDVGSVHSTGAGWLDPKPSAGASFSIADGSVRAEAAWRLDDKARLTPDFRILFSVPQ